MNPTARKTSSEARLRSSGVPINASLPLIESDDEVTLRSAEDVLRRLIALWAVVGKAMLREDGRFADYVRSHNMEHWLSTGERNFLFTQQPTDHDYVQFSWQLESLFFVAWCAGLVDAEDIPQEESGVQSILHLFPDHDETPERLRAAILIRPKSDVLDRADFLYRLHWAVRNAKYTGAPAPLHVNGGVVQEWHRAVNWMIRYDGQDNWDHVGTDT